MNIMGIMGFDIGLKRNLDGMLSPLFKKVCIVRFYRATLCVSAVVAVARCLSVRLSVCLSVCLSVRLSRWYIVSTRLKILSNFFMGQLALSV